ncbi:MAG: hypothetical protein V9G11_01465 [Bifidobacterium adolescentis]
MSTSLGEPVVDARGFEDFAHERAGSGGVDAETHDEAGVVVHEGDHVQVRAGSRA